MRLLVERGLTQERLGELSGLHRNYIGAVERAERTPSLVAADRIARALGTTMADMFSELERRAGFFQLGVRTRLLYQVASVHSGALTGVLILLMLNASGTRVEAITIEILTVVLTFLTAVGAIWAAAAATSQSRAATRQARAAEKSIAQQERNAQEQAERQRLAVTVDLILKLTQYFESETFLETRRRTGRYIKDRYFHPDDLMPVEDLNNAGADVLNFMELLGYLVKNEAIDAQALWERFGVVVVMYWALCKPAIERVRELQKAPWSWEDFEFLNDKMIELFDLRTGETPDRSKENLRAFAQAETVIGTDEEQPDPFAIFRRPQQPF